MRSTPGETVVYLAGQELHLAAGASVPSGVRYYDLEGHTVASRSNATAASSTSGTLSWILSDRQDSASLAVEAATGTATRDRYLPYGGNRATTTGLGGWTMPNDRGWLGQVQDKELGLDYLQARYYDPVLAHFVSTDPFNVQDDPQSANPYGYAAGNPVTFQDPNGLWPSLSKAWNSTASWVSSHKDTIAEVGVGLAVGLVVVGTGGIGGVIIAGAIAGAAGASAGYGVRVAEHKETFSAGGLLKAAAGGAAQGAIGAGLGYAGGKIAAAGVKALAKTGVGKAAGQALSTAARSVKARAAGAAKSAVQQCNHSFDPAQPVLMADRTTKAIGNVEVGEKVLAYDPATGVSSQEPVTELHRNQDSDLVDVVVSAYPGREVPLQGNHPTGLTLTFHTTATHPFYDVTNGAWVEAGNLQKGHQLKTQQGQLAIVSSVNVQTGPGSRRDLTVAEIHTYFVVQGGIPVLVHNCDLAARALEIHGLRTNAFARSRSTVAVVRAAKPNGEIVDVVAGSGRGLTRAQKANLRSNEVVARGVARLHAEQKAIGFIERNGWKPISGGTSRNICRSRCAPLIRASGGRVGGKIYPGNGKATTRQRSIRW